MRQVLCDFLERNRTNEKCRHLVVTLTDFFKNPESLMDQGCSAWLRRCRMYDLICSNNRQGQTPVVSTLINSLNAEEIVIVCQAEGMSEFFASNFSFYINLLTENALKYLLRAIRLPLMNHLLCLDCDNGGSHDRFVKIINQADLKNVEIICVELNNKVSLLLTHKIIEIVSNSIKDPHFKELHTLLEQKGWIVKANGENWEVGNLWHTAKDHEIWDAYNNCVLTLIDECLLLPDHFLVHLVVTQLDTLFSQISKGKEGRAKWEYIKRALLSQDHRGVLLKLLQEVDLLWNYEWKPQNPHPFFVGAVTARGCWVEPRGDNRFRLN